MKTPLEFRQLCRRGGFAGPTAGLVPGYVQANLVILEKEFAFDFLLFCQRNPKPCPIIEVSEVGQPFTPITSPKADLRSDLPRYHIFREGVFIEELTNVTSLWKDDLVAFLLGCSFTFEGALQKAGLPVRHIECQKNVPMYRTNIPCQPAGIFSGSLVVSMRPFTPTQAIKAISISEKYPHAHGIPIHLGDPSLIGISNLEKPDYGESVPLYSGEIPVFWACGVTPQEAIGQSKIPFAITHAPGHMFITDLVEDL